MDVNLVKENEDGSADYQVHMSHEEQAQLFRFAFIEMLKRGIEEGKQHEPLTSESSMGNTGSGTKDCIYGTCVESDKSNCNRVCGSFKVSD